MHGKYLDIRSYKIKHLSMKSDNKDTTDIFVLVAPLHPSELHV